MSAVDWAAHEADLDLIDKRVPAMGAPYRTARACPTSLGEMWCVKPHATEADPVHVAAHRNYGVVALWSDEGGPPQINARLARRVGLHWLAYLFGDTKLILVEPHDDGE